MAETTMGDRGWTIYQIVSRPRNLMEFRYRMKDLEGPDFERAEHDDFAQVLYRGWQASGLPFDTWRHRTYADYAERIVRYA